MAETGTREDPYRAYNFIVDIDGVAQAGFSEAAGLSSESAAVEYREGTDVALTVRKLPGLHTFSNITLKRGFTTSRELWQWRKNILDGRADRRNGAITLLDEERNRVIEWRFKSGWLSKYEAASLNASTSEAAIETIEICHERVEQA